MTVDVPQARACATLPVGKRIRAAGPVDCRPRRVNAADRAAMLRMFDKFLVVSPSKIKSVVDLAPRVHPADLVTAECADHGQPRPGWRHPFRCGAAVDTTVRIR